MAKRSKTGEWAKMRASRVTGAGPIGLQAMSLGLVLGGCVAFGYFGGSWLDQRLGSSFWMPVGVLVGLAAGFHEMFVTLKRISAQTKWPGASDKSHSSEDSSVQDAATGYNNQAGAPYGDTAATESTRTRPRLFEVPEPPIASFDKVKSAKVSRDAPVAPSQPIPAEEAPDALHDFLDEETYAQLKAELAKHETDEQTDSMTSGDDQRR